jgi:hypothetical protein
MKKFFLILLFYFTCQFGYAQNKLTIKADPLIDSLVHKYQEINKAEPQMDGYRIQLFTGADRNNAIAIRSKFMIDFPAEQIYLIYQQPYFKLRVGDYRNLIEAQSMYTQLQKQFGQILIVPDKINLPKL